MAFLKWGDICPALKSSEACQFFDRGLSPWVGKAFVEPLMCWHPPKELWFASSKVSHIGNNHMCLGRISRGIVSPRHAILATARGQIQLGSPCHPLPAAGGPNLQALLWRTGHAHSQPKPKPWPWGRADLTHPTTLSDFGKNSANLGHKEFHPKGGRAGFPPILDVAGHLYLFIFIKIYQNSPDADPNQAPGCGWVHGIFLDGVYVDGFIW